MHALILALLISPTLVYANDPMDQVLFPSIFSPLSPAALFRSYKDPFYLTYEAQQMPQPAIWRAAVPQALSSVGKHFRPAIADDFAHLTAESAEVLFNAFAKAGLVNPHEIQSALQDVVVPYFGTANDPRFIASLPWIQRFFLYAALVVEPTIFKAHCEEIQFLSLARILPQVHNYESHGERAKQFVNSLVQIAGIISRKEAYHDGELGKLTWERYKQVDYQRANAAIEVPRAIWNEGQKAVLLYRQARLSGVQALQKAEHALFAEVMFDRARERSCKNMFNTLPPEAAE